MISMRDIWSTLLLLAVVAALVGAVLLSEWLDSPDALRGGRSPEEYMIVLHDEYPDWPEALLRLVADGTVTEAQAAKHPDWEPLLHEQIAEHKIALGMTTEMVRASWGRPDDVNRYVSLWGVTEQWVYECSKLGYGLRFVTLPCHYLYFDDSILTGWNDI